MAILSIIGAIQAINAVHSTVSSHYAPYKRAMEYAANQSNPNTLNDPNVILTLYFKNLITAQQMYKAMSKYGYSKDEVNYQIAAAKRLLDVTEYIQLWRRKEITDSQLKEYCDSCTFSFQEIENLKKVTEYFPTAGDLIRFAVREVYTQETVTKFGMMEDLPTKFLTEAEKAGLPNDQAKNFWAAHWELPSLSMGYEMFHRGIISKSELDLLMKSLDVMPFWRDKLQKLSYSPYTRVDARRMYGYGVLDYDQLVQSYKDIGYDDEHATAMADFTVKYEDDAYDGITRSSLITAYKRSLISDDQLQESLLGLGLAESVVDFWYNMAVFEKTSDAIESRTSELKQYFLDGLMTLEEIRLTLIQEGLNASYITQIITEFERSKVGRYKNPPLETLERWLEKGIVSEYRFTIGMRRLGYDDETINYYMTELIDPDNPVKRKFLKYETYLEWFVQGIFDEYQTRETLKDMNFSTSDIDILISKAYEQIDANNEEEE